MAFGRPFRLVRMPVSQAQIASVPIGTAPAAHPFAFSASISANTACASLKPVRAAGKPP